MLGVADAKSSRRNRRERRGGTRMLEIAADRAADKQALGSASDPPLSRAAATSRADRRVRYCGSLRAMP